MRCVVVLFSPFAAFLKNFPPLIEDEVDSFHQYGKLNRIDHRTSEGGKYSICWCWSNNCKRAERLNKWVNKINNVKVLFLGTTARILRKFALLCLLLFSYRAGR